MRRGCVLQLGVIFTVCAIAQAVQIQKNAFKAEALDFKKVDVSSQNADGQANSYYVSNFMVSQEDALIACENFIKKQLISIESKEKNDEIKSVIAECDYPNNWFWTSGKFNPSTLWFYWETTGQNFSYSSWTQDTAYNFDGDFGVVVNNNGDSNNWSKGDSIFNFICE